jgi:hypothetical protein
MKTILTYAAAAGCLVALGSTAKGRSAYDGSWDLVFVTQRGACDATYNFSVNINDGVVTHPNLVRFRGYVAGSGSRFGDRSGQTCHGLGKAVGRFRPRDLEWLFRKRALLRLLDRAAKLTSALYSADEALGHQSYIRSQT